MSTIDLQQAQQQLDQLVDAVHAGSEREVVIRDRAGRPAAKLVPLDDHDELRKIEARLRRLERGARAAAPLDPRSEARARIKLRLHQPMVRALVVQREMAAAIDTLQRAFAERLGPPMVFDPSQARKEAHEMFPRPAASRRRLIGIAAGKRPVPADIDAANPEIQRMFEGAGN